MGLKASDFPFQLGSYDPDAYYTRSADRKGHDKDLRVHIQPEIMRCLEIMVESKIWPAYKSKTDIVRDAIYHLLARRLREIDDPPRGSDVFWYAVEEQQMLEREELRQTIQRLVTTVDQQVRRLLAEGLPAEAREQVERVLYRASTASDQVEATWLKRTLRAKLADLWAQLGLPEDLG